MKGITVFAQNIEHHKSIGGGNMNQNHVNVRNTGVLKGLYFRVSLNFITEIS